MDFQRTAALFLVFAVVGATIPLSVAENASRTATVERPTATDRPTGIDRRTTTDQPTTTDRPAGARATTVGNGTNAATFSGTVVVNSTSARFNSTAVARVWANRSSGAYRIEFLAPNDTAWDVVVSNGSRIWAYDRDENVVVTTTEIHGQFAEETTDSVRPFYFDDFFYSSADLSERLDIYHVRSLGRETVLGRDTHVLQIRRTAPAPRIAPDTTTLWLDADYSFPVRIESVSRGGFGGDTRRTLVYRNLTFAATIDSDRFTFEPPAGANVTRQEEFRPSYLPEPKLPADFQMTASGAGVSSTYENDTEIVRRRTLTADYRNLTTTITVTNHTRPNPREDFTVGEGPSTIRANLGDQFPFPSNDSLVPVDVRGVTGAAWTTNGTSYVVWPCKQSYFAVHSTLSRSTVIEIARTVPCSNETAAAPTALGSDDASETVSDSGSPAAEGTRIAPGVTTAGIVNPARLLTAHHETVTAGDFVAVLNETRTVPGENGTATLAFSQRFAYDATSGTYLATYWNQSASDRGPTVVWGNGTTAVARTAKYGHAFYEPPAAPSASVPSGSSYLLSLFSTYDFAVRETTNRTDPDRTTLRLEAERSSVTATLVVDPEGRIYEFTLSGSSDSSGAIRRVEYRLHPDRDVPRRQPEWVSRAPVDAEFRVQMGMEVEPNYVYLSHEYGETILAGTVVELTTANGTYTTRLQNSLEPSENRQLYVRNGSLVVTDDHPEAKRLGRNLSSPVELLLYTDEGVLVYHERFEWSEGDVLSVTPRFEARRSGSYARS